jgi:hypothetical protein
LGNIEPVHLKVPSDKIDIIVKFEVKADATTQVIIDMTADWIAISNSHNLRPVLKATVLTYVEPTNSPGEPPTTSTPEATPTTVPTETPENTPPITPSWTAIP